MANFLTGAAKYADGWLTKLVIFCYDEPDEEMQRLGISHEDYIEQVDRVIDLLKAGDKLIARFGRGRDGEDVVSYPVEVITIGGRETLEVVQQGQPEAHASLRRLPAPGTGESNAWAQKFYDEFMRLSQGSVEMLDASHLAHEMYGEHGNRDPVAVAKEMFDATV